MWSSFLLTLDAPEDGSLRLKHVELYNYLLIKVWLHLMLFLYLFQHQQCASNDFYQNIKFCPPIVMAQKAISIPNITIVYVKINVI
jgi:hypothetical protein